MQGKGARGRKRLVALCSVEGTKLLGGVRAAPVAGGCLWKGLVPESVTSRQRAGWESEKGTYLAKRTARSGAACFVFARRWVGSKKTGRVVSRTLSLWSLAGTQGQTEWCRCVIARELSEEGKGRTVLGMKRREWSSISLDGCFGCFGAGRPSTIHTTGGGCA